MSQHSKNYRQNELKIRRIEATSDRLTGRARLTLFVAYLHGVRTWITDNKFFFKRNQGMFPKSPVDLDN
jgi:hypothetical protein